MQTLEALQKSRDLIANPERWTQGYFARDAKGDEVEWHDPSACKFCVYGSIYRTLGDDEGTLVVEVERALQRATGWTGLATYNDGHSHEAVLAAFDRAIAALTSAPCEESK